MHDALADLRTAGRPVDLLSAPQRAVLAALSEQETEGLVAVPERLGEVGDEVVAHDFTLL